MSKHEIMPKHFTALSVDDLANTRGGIEFGKGEFANLAPRLEGYDLNNGAKTYIFDGARGETVLPSDYFSGKK